MGYDLKQRFLLAFSIVRSIPLIPDHEKPIVGATCENVLVELVPGDILDRGVVI